MVRRARNITGDEHGSVEQSPAIDSILGNSDAIKQVKALIRQVAATDITVLITGESGVGKELVGRALHELSPRARGPLMTLNCGAIPEGLFESEIFGHERGSFTSAEQRRQGYFELADGGTLFLDEIGEMPLPVQVKILRVLETQTFLRVGGSKEIHVNVRVVAATNKDLLGEAAAGRFRQDLYFRLKTVNITIPPLGERVADIPMLAERFAIDFARQNHRPLPTIDPEAVSLLQSYPWQGNVRELKNFVESLVALEIDQRIDAEAVAKRLKPALSSTNLPMIARRMPSEQDRELIYRTLLELRHEVADVKAMVQRLYYGETRIQSTFDSAEVVEPHSLDEVEREQIKRVLAELDGNRRLAAKALGIGERTLYRKLKMYGLSAK